MPSRTIVIVLTAFLLSVFLLFGLRSPASSTIDYPFQENYQKYSASSTSYKIAIVADMDKSSKQDDYWKSSIIYGSLDRDSTGQYSVVWTREVRSFIHVNYSSFI